MNPPVVPTTRRLKRIAPLQLGKMLALLYGAMGLLIAPIFLLFSATAAQLPAGQRFGLLAVGGGLALLAPVFYAAMGFVAGTLGALLYNVAAQWIGGIEVEVE